MLTNILPVSNDKNDGESPANLVETESLVLRSPQIPGAVPGVIFALHEEQEKSVRSSLDQGRAEMRQISSGHSLVSLTMTPVREATSLSAVESLIGLLSALYALLLIIFSLTLELSALLHVKRYDKMPWIYEAFHIYLYGAALLFFGYCHGFYLHRGWIRQVRWSESSLRSRLSKSRLAAEDSVATLDQPLNCQKRVSLTSVSHSGATSSSLFLRLGCIIFGIVSIVSIGMELYQCIEGNVNDDSTNMCDNIHIIKLWMGAAFTFIQMHFIFQNSKMTIHRSKNLARFGTMHLVAVNLWVWLRHLILEEYEVSREFDNVRILEHARVLSDIRTLENVTETVGIALPRDQQSGEKESVNFLFLVTGCSNSQTCIVRESFTPILFTCMIEYSLIAAGVMFVVWRNIGRPALAHHKTRKQNLSVDCSSSTTGLFVGLIFLVATFISLIIFSLKLHADRNAEALWVFSMTDTVLYLVSIGACILGIWQTSKLSYEANRHATGAQLLDDILLIVGLIGQLLFCVSGIVGLVSSHHEQVPNALLSLLAAHVMRLVQVP
uniref:Uncharacterized protein n=1 Tax=Plectus sambesii TaxID=2011161 RepID=A0A914W6K2_9BILA